MLDVQPMDTAALEANLSQIKPLTLQATATSVIPGVQTDFTLVPEGDADVQEQTEDVETEQAEETEEVTEVTEEEQPERPSNAFTEEFKQHFGIEPAEAVELFNGLQAFRDEMQLMREWQVTPVEYDSRISAVREFYNSLPEDGRDQFNSANGAVAIWNHLQQKGQTQTKKTTVKPGTTKAKTAPAPQTLKKSDILRMSKQEYQRNLPAITKAYREGRVLEDA